MIYASMSVIKMEARAQELTVWMGIHSHISAIQLQARRHTRTHTLDGISWLNVSDPNRGQEEDKNSHPGWDFMDECQDSNMRPEGHTGTHTLHG